MEGVVAQLCPRWILNVNPCDQTDGISKPTAARYRTTNWSRYSASLKKRGSLPIWLDKDMSRLAPPDGSPGRPAVFADAAIQFCLTMKMIKVLFKLPLGQTTGMMASLLKMAGLDWAVPDYTTLCQRQKTLAVQMPYRRADGPLNLLVDIEPVSASGSSEPARGIKFLGDREWQAAPIIPIRKNGRPWKKDCLAAIARNEALQATRHYCRVFWKRWTRYHAQSRFKAKMPSQVRSNLWR